MFQQFLGRSVEQYRIFAHRVGTMWPYIIANDIFNVYNFTDALWHCSIDTLFRKGKVTEFTQTYSLILGIQKKNVREETNADYKYFLYI